MEITSRTCVCGSDRDELAGKLRQVREILRKAKLGHEAESILDALIVIEQKPQSK